MSTYIDQNSPKTAHGALVVFGESLFASYQLVTVMACSELIRYLLHFDFQFCFWLFFSYPLWGERLAGLTFSQTRCTDVLMWNTPRCRQYHVTWGCTFLSRKQPPFSQLITLLLSVSGITELMLVNRLVLIQIACWRVARCVNDLFCLR